MAKNNKRVATVLRKTAETDIALSLAIDGRGRSEIATGVPFFDHMLTLFAKHGLFDLTVKAKGDVEVDYHHTVEDVGLVLGQAFKEALGDKVGIKRYGFFILPMDESLARIVVDVGGRPQLVYGDEPHHVAEAIFKCLARALDLATQIEPRAADQLPSTKGKI